MRPFIRQILAVVVLLVSGMSALRGADAPPQNADELMQRVSELLQKATDGLAVQNAERKALGFGEHAFDVLCDSYSVFEMEYETSAKKMDTWPVVLKQATAIYERLQKTQMAYVSLFGDNLTLHSASDAWMLVFKGHYDEAIQLAKQYKAEAKSQDYIKKREREFMVSALVFAYVEKGSYADAAEAVQSDLKEWSNSPRLHAMAAYMLVRAGRLEEARTQCQIMYDLFQKSHELRIVDKISKQYNFNIKPPTVDDLISKYINTVIPEMREAGIVALGGHKIPGAYEALAAYFDDVTTTDGDKRAALKGLMWLNDERGIVFLVNVALSGKSDYAREALSNLCFIKNQKAVLEVLNRGQADRTVLGVMDYMDFALRHALGDGPPQGSTAGGGEPGGRQWVNWLRETGRIETPAKKVTPSLLFAEADERFFDANWFYIKLTSLQKDLDVFTEMENFCNRQVPEVARAKAMGTDGSLSSAEPYRFREKARHAASLQIEVPASFSEQDRSLYKDLFQRSVLCTKEAEECAQELVALFNNKPPAGEVLEALAAMRSRCAKAQASARALFSNDESHRRVAMLIENAQVLMRSAGVEAYCKNIQQAQQAVMLLSRSASPYGRDAKMDVAKTISDARQLLSKHKAAGRDLKSDILAKEYYGYYQQCGEVVDEAEAILANKKQTTVADIVKGGMNKATRTLGERGEYFAKLAAAIEREKITGSVVPLCVFEYSKVLEIRAVGSKMTDDLSECEKYMADATSIQDIIERLLTDSDKWVAANNSKGKYDGKKISFIALNKAFAAGWPGWRGCGGASGGRAFEGRGRKWEAVRVPLAEKLLALKKILDSESYKSKGVAVYNDVADQVRQEAAKTRGIFDDYRDFLEQIVADVSPKMLEQAGVMMPMGRMMNAASATLTRTVKAAWRGVSRKSYTPASFEESVANIKLGLSELASVQKDASGLDTSRWPHAWAQAFGDWRNSLTGISEAVRRSISGIEARKTVSVEDVMLMESLAERLKGDTDSIMMLINSACLPTYEGDAEIGS